MKKSVSNDQTLGILSVVFSSLGIVAALLLPFFGIVFGIVGIVLALVQRKRGKTTLARWGLILGIVAIVLAVLLIILFVKLIYPQLQELGDLGGAYG